MWRLLGNPSHRHPYLISCRCAAARASCQQLVQPTGKVAAGPSLLFSSGLGRARLPGPLEGLLVGVDGLAGEEEGATRFGVPSAGSGGRARRGACCVWGGGTDSDGGQRRYCRSGCHGRHEHRWRTMSSTPLLTGVASRWQLTRTPPTQPSAGAAHRPWLMWASFSAASRAATLRCHRPLPVLCVPTDLGGTPSDFVPRLWKRWFRLLVFAFSWRSVAIVVLQRSTLWHLSDWQGDCLSFS